MLKNRIFIIAEAGVNHNGELEIALKMVDAAAEAGADAVKFQTFRAESMVSRSAAKAYYQKNTAGESESQIEMLKKLELDMAAHKELIARCAERNIEFLSSPFDSESIDMLVSLGLKTFKIPSGEINNLPYLRKLGRLNKKIILSTGMSEMTEIGDALDILTKEGTRREDITVLHCSTAYPAPHEEANLRAMAAMKKEFNVLVGYSDHTPGMEAAIAAAALGASVIEKHFTLDKSMPGPDHKASLSPEELKAMVKAVRNTEKALGDGVKRPLPCELKNKPVVRKSIVAMKDITEGDLFSEDNITTKRPALGINPMEWDSIMGKTAKRDFSKDELIEL